MDKYVVVCRIEYDDADDVIVYGPFNSFGAAESWAAVADPPGQWQTAAVCEPTQTVAKEAE